MSNYAIFKKLDALGVLMTEIVKFTFLKNIRLIMKDKKDSLDNGLYRGIFRDLLIISGLVILGLVFLYFGFRVANPFDIILNIFAGLTILVIMAVGTYMMVRIHIIEAIEIIREDTNRNNTETP